MKILNLRRRSKRESVKTPGLFSYGFLLVINSYDRGVAQLVARVVRDDEAAGSSPVTPTVKWIKSLIYSLIHFFYPDIIPTIINRGIF